MANHQSDTMSSKPYNLTPGQEDLLTAALNSNKSNNQSNNTNGWVSTLDNSLDSILYPHIPGTAGNMNEYRMDFLKGAEDLDFSLDSIDANAEYDDDLDDHSPVEESAEPHEKRQRPDEDASKDDAGSKRQEGVEKVPKKPGRKPLTVEPTNVSLSFFVYGNIHCRPLLEHWSIGLELKVTVSFHTLLRDPSPALHISCRQLGRSTAERVPSFTFAKTTGRVLPS